MKRSEKEPGLRVRELLEKRWIVWVPVLAGALLLLLPGKRGAEDTGSREETEALPACEELEARLETVLSQVEGAGKVAVLLSPERGQQSVPAENSRLRQDGTETEREEEILVISDGDGEETVTLQVLAEQYRGAVIVAEGGGDPGVALALTRAVSAATGLGADRITVMKMKRS